MNRLVKKNKNLNINGAVYRKLNLQNNVSGTKTTKVSDIPSKLNIGNIKS